MMDTLRKCIVDYIRDIGEDCDLFSNDNNDIKSAFEKWTCYHYDRTQSHSVWRRTREIFIGSQDADRLFRNPLTTFNSHMPFCVGMEMDLCPRSTDYDLRSVSKNVQMGISMAECIRDRHVAMFSQPLKTEKPGRVVSTQILGMSCTADIELLDEDGLVNNLLEVKTMPSASVEADFCIPDTPSAAKSLVKGLLAEKEAYVESVGKGTNIFRQKSRFVDLELVEEYGFSHLDKSRIKNAAEAYLPFTLFLESYKSRKKEDVNFYFYNAWDETAKPAKAFSMPMEEFGLIVNPLSQTTKQMFIRQCVYMTSYCRMVRKTTVENTFMYLLLVVPYKGNASNPKPYLIMKMPVFFPYGLCQRFCEFYETSVLKHLRSSR